MPGASADWSRRCTGVLAGMRVVDRLIAQFELIDKWDPRLRDGDRLEAGSLIARVNAPMRSLLVLERTALNFLQRLSGIATLTASFVAAVTGTRASIYDTRKTTPGWRALEKYAVRCGGGCNHRFGLFDAVLIKDNHLAWLQSAARPGDPDPIAVAIAAARAHTPPGTTVEIEVDSLEQLDVALVHGPDIVLIDNLGPALLAEAVRRRDTVAPSIQLEASGGVNLAHSAGAGAIGRRSHQRRRTDALGSGARPRARLRGGACPGAVGHRGCGGRNVRCLILSRIGSRLCPRQHPSTASLNIAAPGAPSRGRG